MFDEAFVPVPEYNTWIGTFGTPETREQDKLARALCKELNLTMREPAGLRHLESDRLLQVARNRFRNAASDEPLPLSSLNEFFWSPAKTADRLAKLIDDGVLEKVGSDRFRLR